MTRLRTGLALATTLTLALGVVACSSNDEKNEYVDQVNELQTQYAADIAELGTPSNTGDLRELAREGAALDQQLAEDVAAIDPPEEVTDLHEQLVDLLQESADATTEVQELVQSTDNPQRIQQALTEIDQTAQRTQGELNSLIDQINEEL